MTDKNLIVQPKIIFSPVKDTAKAKKAADQLIDIVKQNGWSIKLGGKSEHLMYEAWQTVGKYYNCTVATGEAENVEIGEVTGFKAKAWVIDNKTGIRVGEAEAYCMKDEANWKIKPLFQLASMAQTRAGSKALRQIFGFVVALAGYNPTPAEEMIKDDPDWVKNGQTQTINLASEKQINFIKGLLDQKGYTREQLAYKFKVKTLEELTKDQASDIIMNLQSLPPKSDGDQLGETDAGVPTGASVSEEVDPDEADKAINA